MKTSVKNYNKQNGTQVRAHYRTCNQRAQKVIEDIKKLSKVTRDCYGVYNKIMSLENFINGSKEQKYNIAYQEAITQCIPQAQAIEIAVRISEGFAN